MFDGKALGEHLTVVVRDYVSRATSAFGARCDELAAQIKVIPAGFSGRIEALEEKLLGVPDAVAIQRILDKALAAIPPIKPPEIDYALIEAGIAKAAAALPLPPPGKDAVVDYDRIGTAIKETVRVAVSELPKPKDGESVHPDTVARLVREAVDAIPRPKDGQSVDLVALSTDITAAAVKAVEALPKPKDGCDYDPVVLDAAVNRAIAALPAPKEGAPAVVDYDRIGKAIEEVVAEAVAAIPAAAPGKDADPVDYARVLADVASTVKALTEAEVGRVVAAIPPPRDGVDADEAAIVAKVLAALPEPKKGEPGKDANPVDTQAIVAEVLRQIPPAAPGKDADEDAILGQLFVHADRIIGAIPVPKDGEPGKSVTLDDVRPLFDAALSAWALEFERRAADTLQRAIDRIPAPKDGQDGFGLEDLAIDLDPDGRTLRIRFVGGETVVERAIRFDVMIYRGIWKQARYIRGDTVTFAGSLWHANRDTDEKPGSGSADWTLCAKRGADAK